MSKKMLRFLLLALLLCGMALPARPAAASDDHAQIHVLHLVADGPAVDVLIDDEVQLEELSPGTFSDILEVKPGDHTLVLTPHGEEDAAIGPLDVTLEAGHRYTVAAMGQAADDDLSALVIDETAEMEGVDMAANTFRIIINNIAGSPPISFYEAGEFLEKNIAYGSYSAQAFTPFSWDTGMAVAGEDLEDVVFPFDTEADNFGGFWEPYTVYVYGLMGTYPGTPDEDYTFAMPSVSVVAPDAASFLAAFTPYDLTIDYKTYLRFDSLLTAWQSAGFTATLSAGGPYTIFAPTDAAMEALSKRKVNALLADPDALREMLLTHVVQGAMTSEDMLAAGSVQTLQGTKLTVIESEDDGLTFGLGDNADVYDFPYALADGTLIYLVRNQVLMPEPAAEPGSEMTPDETPDEMPEITPEATPTAPADD